MSIFEPYPTCYDTILIMASSYILAIRSQIKCLKSSLIRCTAFVYPNYIQYKQVIISVGKTDLQYHIFEWYKNVRTTNPIYQFAYT